MSTPGKNPNRMVRAFCKKHGICVSYFPTLDGAPHNTLRQMQPCALEIPEIPLRPNFERGVKAGICVRCHRRPRTSINKRSQQCQGRQLSGIDSQLIDSPRRSSPP
jgi:hypothetical protein